MGRLCHGLGLDIAPHRVTSHQASAGRPHGQCPLLLLRPRDRGAPPAVALAGGYPEGTGHPVYSSAAWPPGSASLQSHAPTAGWGALPQPPDLPLTAQSGTRSFFVLGAWVPAQLLAASAGAGGGNAPSKRPGVLTRSPRAPDPAGPAHTLWTKSPHRLPPASHTAPTWWQGALENLEGSPLRSSSPDVRQQRPN